MKKFVLITAYLEAFAGIGMAIVPHLIPDLADANALPLALANMYGVAAISIGLFSFHVHRNMNNSAMVKSWLTILSLFHFGVAGAGLKGFLNEGFDTPSVAILHFIFFLITAFFLV